MVHPNLQGNMILYVHSYISKWDWEVGKPGVLIMYGFLNRDLSPSPLANLDMSHSGNARQRCCVASAVSLLLTRGHQEGGRGTFQFISVSQSVTLLSLPLTAPLCFGLMSSLYLLLKGQPRSFVPEDNH